MKQTSPAIAKFITILAIALIVVLAAQLVISFLPCFTLTPKATRLNPDPVPTNYSIMSYCWTDTEDMSAAFDKMIKKYDVNDYVITLVLTSLFTVLTLVTTSMETYYAATKYRTAGATAIRVLSYIFGLAWTGMSTYCFLTNGIFQYAGPSGALIKTLSLVLGIAGGVLLIARLVLAVLPKKAKAAA